VKIGDHIEKINDKSLIGTRHFEVAKMLKELPVGSTFTMRVVEPNAFGFRTFREAFSNVSRRCSFVDIEPAKRGRKTGDVKNGTKTLRFKADGRASVEDVDDKMVKAIDRINGLLETFMGINDSDLGTFVSRIDDDHLSNGLMSL
jgi:PDZ domain-containing protein GIPC